MKLPHCSTVTIKSTSQSWHQAPTREKIHPHHPMWSPSNPKISVEKKGISTAHSMATLNQSRIGRKKCSKRIPNSQGQDSTVHSGSLKFIENKKTPLSLYELPLQSAILSINTGFDWHFDKFFTCASKAMSHSVFVEKVAHPKSTCAINTAFCITGFVHKSTHTGSLKERQMYARTFSWAKMKSCVDPWWLRRT